MHAPIQLGHLYASLWRILSALTAHSFVHSLCLLAPFRQTNWLVPSKPWKPLDQYDRTEPDQLNSHDGTWPHVTGHVHLDMIGPEHFTWWDMITYDGKWSLDMMGHGTWHGWIWWWSPHMGHDGMMGRINSLDETSPHMTEQDMITSHEGTCSTGIMRRDVINSHEGTCSINWMTGDRTCKFGPDQFTWEGKTRSTHMTGPDQLALAGLDLLIGPSIGPSKWDLIN